MATSPLSADSSTEDKIDRHCGFCHIFIPSKDVKHCAKCHRRAYCNKKCQAKDWKSKVEKEGKGQGHRDWCGLSYGEEDLDWIITNIPGKGKGLVAKRSFPFKSRIMVDGYKDLDIFGPEAQRSLNQSLMANHSCENNCGKFPDPDYKVMIYHAKRDIEAGEEITTNYVGYLETFTKFEAEPYFTYRSVGIDRDGYFPTDSLQDVRSLLESKWGIVCPPSCFCRTEGLDELVTKAREEFELLSNADAPLTLDLINRLLEKHQQLHAGLVYKARILENGFSLAMKRKKTRAMGKRFIKEANDIYTSILHPEGRFGKETTRLMNEAKNVKK